MACRAGHLATNHNSSSIPDAPGGCRVQVSVIIAVWSREKQGNDEDMNITAPHAQNMAEIFA
jgi:hypothetical protein